MDIDHALTDPGFFADHDPHPLWQQLRREDPVHWTEGLVRPFWSVTRPDDIVGVFSEPNLFTSERGLNLPSSPEMEHLTPEMMGAGRPSRSRLTRYGAQPQIALMGGALKLSVLELRRLKRLDDLDETHFRRIGPLADGP